jgi:restriction endonuclease S subunit
LNNEFKTAVNIEEQYILKNNDFLFARSGNTVGKTFLYEDKYGKCLYAGYLIRFRLNSEKILPKYLKYFTTTSLYWNWIEKNITGSSQPNINGKIYSSLNIPLPPIDIQKQIVEECEKVDNEVIKANEFVKQIEQTIKDNFITLYTKVNKSYRLSDTKLFDAFIGKRVLAKDIEDKPTDEAITVYSANVYEPFGYTQKEFMKDFSNESILWGIDGDWMVNFIPKEIPFYPTDHCGVLRVKTDEINPKYLRFALEQEGIEKRFSRSHRASTDRIKALTIKAPSIYEQNLFAEKLEKFESQMNEAKKLIEESKAKKEAILKHYL